MASKKKGNGKPMTFEETEACAAQLGAWKYEERGKDASVVCVVIVPRLANLPDGVTVLPCAVEGMVELRAPVFTQPEKLSETRLDSARADIVRQASAYFARELEPILPAQEVVPVHDGQA